MREILEALVRAMHDQAIAMQTVAEQVAALKQTLAKRDEALDEELKRQIEAITQQTVADRVTTLQQALAAHNGGLAGVLKVQVEEDQEKTRAMLYDLQVGAAKLQEAIAGLAKAGVPAEKKAASRVQKAPAGGRKAHKAASRRRV